MVSKESSKKRSRVEGDEEVELDEGTSSDVVMEEDSDAEANDDEKKSSDDTTQDDSSKPSSSFSPQEVFSPALLSQYYSRLFPFHFLHSWLSYDPLFIAPQQTPDAMNGSSKQGNTNKVFSKREFSFTLMGPKGEDIYIRYQSFPNGDDLRKAILKRQPVKIDIGAVFNHPPKDHNAIQGGGQRKFHPEQRELVFDVDLTDYDGVRNCGCTGAKICPKCWTMMNMAMKVMDQGLRADFGFKHIAWFYSGRRGVHAWVCDESARMLSDHARSAVATYFEVNLGTEKNQHIELTNPLHPTLSRAYEILEPMFISSILPASGHGILASLEECEKLLSTLPQAAQTVSERLIKKWTSNSDESTPEEKWDDIKRHLHVLIQGTTSGTKQKKQKISNADRNKLELWPVSTVFKYCYPRLDINVSKMQNHLLKSPFCVHPKTGRVCVPINIEKVNEFNPFEVPTIGSLMRELDDYDSQIGNDENDSKKSKRKEYEWEKTSLNESFSYFKREILAPMWKDLKRDARDRVEQKAALVGDW